MASGRKYLISDKRYDKNKYIVELENDISTKISNLKSEYEKYLDTSIKDY
jgi:hypothetical protein